MLSLCSEASLSGKKRENQWEKLILYTFISPLNLQKFFIASSDYVQTLHTTRSKDNFRRLRFVQNLSANFVSTSVPSSTLLCHDYQLVSRPNTNNDRPPFWPTILLAWPAIRRILKESNAKKNHFRVRPESRTKNVYCEAQHTTAYLPNLNSDIFINTRILKQIKPIHNFRLYKCKMNIRWILIWNCY